MKTLYFSHFQPIHDKPVQKVNILFFLLVSFYPQSYPQAYPHFLWVTVLLFLFSG